MNLRLGKQPATPKATDFKLKAYQAVGLPPLPTRPFGYGTRLSDWKMLGNDSAGDCVWAGAAHETMLYGWLRSSHPIVPFDDKSVLSDYSAVTGYASDPNTDQGTNVHDAMSYRRKTGVLDASGKRHLIDAYVSIDAGDFDLMLRCVWTFGAVGIGFNFPESAWSQFDKGEVWDVVDGARIDGGHYVPMVGSTNPTKEASFVTWGRRARMTKAFYEKYNDEAWIPLSREMMHASGLNWRHLDWDTLSADLAAL
jgi:hypothetical protein